MKRKGLLPGRSCPGEGSLWLSTFQDGERRARPLQWQGARAFHCPSHINCLTRNGLKSQMPFARPCLTQPLPQAGWQREHTPLFPGSEEPLRKGSHRLPWDPRQSLAHSDLQQSTKAEHEPAGKRREQMAAQTRRADGSRQEQMNGTFPAGQGRLCSFKSPSSLPAHGVKEKSDTFFSGGC